MKYVVVLPDGVSDKPLPELGNKTPLEVAKHPNMDWIAQQGIAGWCKTIPDGFKPGSDVGCMSVFGYDPKKYYTGRAPLEAAAQGIPLPDGAVAFRCNTVAVENGILTDYSAGHIESEDSKQLIQAANERLGKHGLKFHNGVSYRHLAVVASDEWRVTSEELAKTPCTPPHDISGQPIAQYLPSGKVGDRLRKIMEESVMLLRDHPVNVRRRKAGKTPATMLWFWGQGTAAKFPPFAKAHGKRGACISAVDIVRGLGKLVDLKIITRPDFTGYFDTNYKGKAEEALKALDGGMDFVLVHVEPTDEAGHMGDAKKKVQAIEDTDRLVVGTLLEGLKTRGEPFGILIVCDHPTSTALKTHIVEPVPFALYASGMNAASNARRYTETDILRGARLFDPGYELMAFFLHQGRE